jgi:pSer/pThr/pTyr-binding forkhead associated (FHA) protein/tetratricopeptide (TPR) repeat protein
MSKLVVRLHGQEIATLELENGHEYLAGRADDAAILLPSQKGISRHHLKFYQRDGVWIVELLARFGALMQAGRASEVIELKESCGFSAPPFEFAFTIEEPEPITNSSAGSSPAAEDKSALMPSVRRETHLTHSNQPPGTEGNFEKTQTGQQVIVPYLRISSKQSGREEVLKLEGMLWVAGRDQTCEIHLEESRASRRHFEISRTHEGFFITDLDSANGTLLNDEKLSPNEPWQLASGDTIRVAGAKVVFEVRDPEFAARVPALPGAVGPDQVLAQLPSPYLPMPYLDPNQPSGLYPGAAVVKLEGAGGVNWKDPKQWKAKNLKKIDVRKNKVRIAILALLPLIVFKLLSGEGKPAVVGDQSDNSSTSPTFDQLSPEKKRAVKDSFTLAKTMYMQGKYTLCLSEMGKLHQLVPAFENSGELENLCKQGQDLTVKNEELERREREKEEATRLITAVVEDCRRKMDAGTTVEKVRECLADALERDPEHPLIMGLIQEVQIARDEKERQRQGAEAEKNRRINGQRLFEKARAHFKAGEFSKALADYEKFLNGGYAGMSDEKSQAQRDVAQVRKEIGEKVKGLLAACKENLDKAQFKPALQACDRAISEDPDNSDAKRLRAQAVSEMKRELKSMYEDSVLEESMGNIDTAKERWKQIMEKSVPGDEYYNKAKRALQKYGVGM